MNITTRPYAQATKLISAGLEEQLAQGPTLILLSGGSASLVYQELAQTLSLKLQPGELVVGLVDERYDLNPNHIDSNDKLICSTGLISRFESLGAMYSPILHGRPMAEEVAQYEYQLTQFKVHEGRRLLLILGIGHDGHTAGILPDGDMERFNSRFNSENLVVGYSNTGPHPERITTTYTLLRQAHLSIVLIKDSSKLPLIKRATNSSYPEPLNALPATILQEMNEVIIAQPNEEEA